MHVLRPEPVVDPHEVAPVGASGRLVQVTAGLEPPFGHDMESLEGRRRQQPVQLASWVKTGGQPTGNERPPYPGFPHRVERPRVLHPVATATPPVPHVMASFTARQDARSDVDTGHRETPVKHAAPDPHSFPANRPLLTLVPRKAPSTASWGTGGSADALPAFAATKQPERATSVIHRRGRLCCSARTRA